ncbi:MAG TPA: DUF1648 domain-containing protein [Galbitalea sp.]|jgi:hypothetical protein
MTSATHGIRVQLVTLVIPLLIALVALVVTFAVASTAPGTVIVHWGAGGRANGYGSPFTYPILIAVICLPLDAIFGAIAILSSHRTPLTVMTKIIGLVGLFITVLLAVGLGGSLVSQTGNASLDPASIVWLPIGFGVAAVLTVGAWFLLPKASKVSRDKGTPVAPVALTIDERASWIHSATAPASLMWGVVGFLVLITAIVFFTVSQRNGALWPVSFIPTLILLVVLSNFAWTIRVDARGVRMRSSIGIPTITVPLSTIESASVIDVQAIAQYGGFGMRWGLNHRFGVILRSGEALEIQRRGGRSVVVTVDDATSAAALINGLVDRASTVARL